MADPGEDVQELKFMLQHYKEEYGPEIQKLRDENVQLKAKVAYLQQKNAELSELLRQTSMTGHSESGPAATPPTSPVVRPPSNVARTPSTSRNPSKLQTPPLSSAGSTHDPLIIHDSDEEIGAENSNAQNIHPLPEPTGPPKRRKSSPERKHTSDLLPDFSLPSKDKGKQPVFKKRKCDVFVLVPPDRKHPVKASPKSLKLERKYALSSSLSRPKFDDLWDYSSDSSLTSLDDDNDNEPTSGGPMVAAHRPRSPERDLTYLDPPDAMPVDLDDRRDPSYIPSRLVSPVPSTPTKRPSRTTSSRKANEQPKPPASVRSATIPGKSSSARADPDPGPSNQQRPPQPPPLYRRVTLHLSPPFPVAASQDRLAGLTRFDVNVANRALLQPTISRRRFSELWGGNAMRMCVPVGGRNFFFPTLKQNPRLPTDVGMPGLLYRANVEPEWKGIVQTVFVGLRGAEYKYVGEYRLTLGERLSVDEYRALAAPMRRKWADGVVKKSKFKDIRVRIRTRREHNREATAEEVALVHADKDDKCAVSEEDVMQAYQSGQERLLVWRMQCVGFDEAFLADLVSKL